MCAGRLFLFPFVILQVCNFQIPFVHAYAGPQITRPSKSQERITSDDITRGSKLATAAPPAVTAVYDSITEGDQDGEHGIMTANDVAASRCALIAMVALGTGFAASHPAEALVNTVQHLPSEVVSEASVAVDWSAIFQKASKRALGGGKAGASAAVVQVLSLMWLRTSMNYQYRYGGNLKSSISTLWEEGGVARLYQGLPWALVQGPLTRFGDTAANVGILVLLESIPETQSLPLALKTACGSVGAGLWRIVLMPIDASKTAMQVEGSEGLNRLWSLVRLEGPGALYQGALAQAAATAVGHFPWFLTYNFLDAQIPPVSSSEDLILSLGRSAFLGFGASCVSDICSNSLRVIKTTKQTARLGQDGNATANTTYREVVQLILEKDGVAGLFGRGLQTRLLTNSIQGAVFSVLWKYLQQAQ